MNYSSANIQGWQPFSFTLATLLYCHEGFITVESQVVFMISIQNVGKELFTYHLVRDGEFGFSFMHSADGQHSEVEKQSVLSTRLPND